MIKLFLADCVEKCEHESGVSLALYAIWKTFGIRATLAYTDNGKPYIDKSGIYVSISHSDKLCAAAVSDGELGVDIERIKHDRTTDRLIRLSHRFFTAGEHEYVLADPSVRFWEIWTAKESFIKFTGEGLIRPLNSFSVFDVAVNYNRFVYSDWAGCICSREAAQIKPLFVNIDEISNID